MKHYDAVVFDLDGVVTQTAKAHALSWKLAFDEYLMKCIKLGKKTFKKFSIEDDYRPFIDGKPRYKGVAAFLASRNVQIPSGSSDDASDQETVCGLGNLKNEKFHEILKQQGPEIFHSTVDLIHDLKKNHIKVGVASSSKNCQLILKETGLEELFETIVDGIVSAQLGLKGKPEGDIFVTAAKNLGCSPLRSVVIEDALSGVQAGQQGGFALVIGVARENNEKELKENGADVVVKDFQGVFASTIDQWLANKEIKDAII